MNKKKLMILVMSVVMAFGMMLVFTACGDTDGQSGDGQDTEQADVSGDGGDADSGENAEDVAASVSEYVNLAGEYQDEWSQRASATVIADTESRNVNITVTWSGSATEMAVWSMSAVKDGNKLVYSDCKKTIQTYSEELDEPEDVEDDPGDTDTDIDGDDGSGDTDTDDNDTDDTDADDNDTDDTDADDTDADDADDVVEGGAKETVEYENGSGSFEITDDGKLLWNGASEPDCQSCVFVKASE